MSLAAMARLLPIALLLVASAAVVVAQPQPATGTRLQTLINDARIAQRLPGLAAVVVRSEGAPQVYVSGERRTGKGDPIAPTDRMHLGSLTKAITATVVGALAEQGRMTLDTTIAQAFPDLVPKMQPAYRQVTVRQLLAHAAGVPRYNTRESLQRAAGLKGTATEQRREFIARVLAEPPRFEPGTSHEYSNAGAAIAGAMAERFGGAPYQELVETLVFAPLGGRARFGNPGLAAQPQPWGHTRTFFGGTVEIEPAHPVYTTPLAIEPAGDVSPSLPDYGRFLQLHLRGLRGRDDVLRAKTIQDLHTKVPPVNWALGFVMGWVVSPRDGGPSHGHTGSYGAYVATVMLQPSRDVAVGVFTNVGDEGGLRDTLTALAGRIATIVASP